MGNFHPDAKRGYLAHQIIDHYAEEITIQGTGQRGTPDTATGETEDQSAEWIEGADAELKHAYKERPIEEWERKQLEEIGWNGEKYFAEWGIWYKGNSSFSKYRSKLEFKGLSDGNALFSIGQAGDPEPDSAILPFEIMKRMNSDGRETPTALYQWLYPREFNLLYPEESEAEQPQQIVFLLCLDHYNIKPLCSICFSLIPLAEAMIKICGDNRLYQWADQPDLKWWEAWGHRAGGFRWAKDNNKKTWLWYLPVDALIAAQPKVKFFNVRDEVAEPWGYLKNDVYQNRASRNPHIIIEDGRCRIDGSGEMAERDKRAERRLSALLQLSDRQPLQYYGTEFQTEMEEKKKTLFDKWA